MGTRGALTDTSTLMECRLGAERSLVQIQSPDSPTAFRQMPLCMDDRRRFRAASPLGASALAVLASRPAAGSALAFLELLLCPANAALPGRLLLGVLDPADEFVTGQGCDVVPCVACRSVGDQRLA